MARQNSGNVIAPPAVHPLVNPSSPTHFVTAHLRVRPRYVLALAASLALHVAVSLWPAEFTRAPAPPPLQATITELPPTPQVVAPAEPKPKPKAPRGRESTARAAA